MVDIEVTSEIACLGLVLEIEVDVVGRVEFFIGDLDGLGRRWDSVVLVCYCV